jgi:hypothetical protein
MLTPRSDGFGNAGLAITARGSEGRSRVKVKEDESIEYDSGVSTSGLGT